MELSFLPTPESDCTQRTEAHFTVRSANSPSYGLTRRLGVRKQRSLPVRESGGVEDTGERERYGKNYGTNLTNTGENGIATYQTRIGGASNVRAQPELKEPSGQELLKQNGTEDKQITTPDRREESTFESRGRAEWRRSNVTSRSKSLDRRTEERSPVRGGADILLTTRGVGSSNQTGAAADTARCRVMSSIQAYTSAGRSTVQEKSPVSDQTFFNRVNSLPPRLKSQLSPGSRFTDTASSHGPTGGQSILERIEKLYGSAGFGKAEGAGGTFPRRFSAGERNPLSPVQSFKSVTWTPHNATPTSETTFVPDRTRRFSGGLWQGNVQSKYSEESAVTWGKGLADVGTRSLDRARSRNSVAAQIRSARAAGGINATPATNSISEYVTSGDLKDSIRPNKWVNHDMAKSESHDSTENYGTKEKPLTKTISIDEEVFDFNPSKITLRTTERKNVPGFSSSASVRNKISQFEALSQKAQSLTTGQGQTPRRTFSVPTQQSNSYEGVKKSGSAKEISGMRDKWEGLKEGGKVHDDVEKETTGAGKKFFPERFLSEEAGAWRKERDHNELAANDRTEKSSEEFGKYSRFKSTLEIPPSREVHSHRRNYYLDETDFAKVSSPEEASEKHMTSPDLPSPPKSNPSDPFSDVQKTTRTLSVDDEDKTPTNTPTNSPQLSPSALPENPYPATDTNDGHSVFTPKAKTPDQDPLPLPQPLASSPYSNLPDWFSPEDSSVHQKRKTPALDLNAWVAGLNSAFKVWNADEDYEDDDDDSTQRDDDSNYDSDSDSGESSVTITSNMSQSDHRSFSVSLSDLCNFAGVEYESENDSDEWQSGRRSVSLSSDVSALSCVSVMPTEELDRLLEDVRNFGDDNPQDYNAVQVVVLHKDMGVGLGFSVAGGIDQSKPVTVHRVFHSGIAAQEGSIRQGDQVLSINGTALSDLAHWEVLRVLRRAKAREMGVVVLRSGDVPDISRSGVQTSVQTPSPTQLSEPGQDMCVSLEKNDRDLGFSLEGGVGSSLGNRPLTVQKIFQGGPVDKVLPGDEILEIEGVTVVGMRRLEAWTLIRKLPSGPVDVVLRRPLKHLQT